MNLGRAPFHTTPETIWENGRDRIVLSARAGGRVISWRHGEAGELVKPPDVVDGGLLRVLFGEERHPGTSHITPHLVRVVRNDARGFEVHLRHYWNTPNAIARLIGWHDKVNPCYLDGLLLDKTVLFDAALSTLTVELEITNLTGETRRLTPWLHNHFHGWVHDAFVVVAGEKQPCLWQDIYWAGHRAEPGKPMRLVHASRDGAFQVVLGASSDWLAGMVSMTRADFGDASTDGCMELRGRTLALGPGQRWRGNAFLALGESPDAWRRWATDSPVPLFGRVEDAPATGWNCDVLLPLLAHWALPEERKRGVMVLSALDKVPFTATARYAATNSFSRFHLDKKTNRAKASVVVVPLPGMSQFHVHLRGPALWKIGRSAVLDRPGISELLVLDGPADLTGKDHVEVQLLDGDTKHLSLRVEPDAVVEPRYSLQVKQTSTYLDERWRAEKSGFTGTTAAEFGEWQRQTRERFRKWIRDAVIGPAPLAPRLMERQVGPHCVREKLLLQTEPGLWLPTYLIRPKEIAQGEKLPAILFPHGSGPGKLHFAPDETADVQDPATFDQWPSPYQFAHRLRCIVLIPDRRGWGEWADANHGQRSQRAWQAGYNIVAMDVWDHLRAVEYLAQRPDVDPARIVSMGSSGGGWITMLVLGAAERVAGGIVSSSITTRPSLPEQYFDQTFGDENGPINPPPFLPLAPATILCLAAPRPLWIMDGKWDRGVLPSLPHTKDEAQAAFAKWHDEANAGRSEVARVYRLVGAQQHFQCSWFEGGHLAGFTLNHIAPWLKRVTP